MIYLVDSSFKHSDTELDYDLTFGWSKSLEILGGLLESALEESLPNFMVVKFDHSFAPFLEAAAPFVPFTYVRNEEWGGFNCFSVGAKIDQISEQEFLVVRANAVNKQTSDIEQDTGSQEGIDDDGVLEGVKDAEDSVSQTSSV